MSLDYEVEANYSKWLRSIQFVLSERVRTVRGLQGNGAKEDRPGRSGRKVCCLIKTASPSVDF